MPKKSSNTKLNELDWNFDGVPENELVACCYWEYARESEFIVARLKAYRKNWYCAGGEMSDSIRKFWDDIERIQSIGYRSEVFVRGCVFEPGQVWQSHDREKPNFRHPHAPPITGSFPAPWQSLSKEERGCRAHIRNDVEQNQIIPVKLAHWSWAKEIARECQQSFEAASD
jgi:hypothetical protein